MKEGTVHQPEVFDMVVKGYNIDTSDFVINTEDNVRFNEPNHNQWTIQENGRATVGAAWSNLRVAAVYVEAPLDETLFKLSI